MHALVTPVQHSSFICTCEMLSRAMVPTRRITHQTASIGTTWLQAVPPIHLLAKHRPGLTGRGDSHGCEQTDQPCEAVEIHRATADNLVAGCLEVPLVSVGIRQTGRSQHITDKRLGVA